MPTDRPDTSIDAILSSLSGVDQARVAAARTALRQGEDKYHGEMQQVSNDQMRGFTNTDNGTPAEIREEADLNRRMVRSDAEQRAAAAVAPIADGLIKGKSDAELAAEAEKLRAAPDTRGYEMAAALDAYRENKSPEAKRDLGTAVARTLDPFAIIPEPVRANVPDNDLEQRR